MNVKREIPKEIFIIGGGSSIKEGISKCLWDKLAGKFVIGLNYSYKYFPNPTFQCFVDSAFYLGNEKGLTPEQKALHIEKMKTLPLIIGAKEKQVKWNDNTIILNDSSRYTRDLSKGVYKRFLAGIFSLSLAIYLLDVGTIYLLGYDSGDLGQLASNGKKLTHFYQEDLKHKGSGKVRLYNEPGRPDRDFAPFKDEQEIDIYNVSLNSKITIFPKISYDYFLFQLDPREHYDQDYIRTYIKDKLKNLRLN